MPKKPADLIAVKVRLRERTRRNLEAEAKRNGVSVNMEIVNRVERSFSEQAITAVIADTANKTAEKFAAAIIEHVHNLMRDTAGELQKIGLRLDQTDRVLNLHELVLNARKGDSSNG
jgi:hypothetical protein